MSGDARIDEALMEEALAIAEEAAELTLRWFQGSGLDVRKKQDGTVVTEADVAAEDLIRSMLRDRFPDDGIFGEEGGESAGSSGRRWIVDPIDGTVSFVRGVPLYSTLLALVDDHGPAVGVICLPALGETVAAGRGLGAFFNGTPCRVSDTDDLSEALLTASAFDADWWGSEPLLAIASSGAQTRTWGD
ncbi:MAG: inositol monophosphatase family protein, partial [Acidimicrobiia bacterium]